MTPPRHSAYVHSRDRRQEKRVERRERRLQKRAFEREIQDVFQIVLHHSDRSKIKRDRDRLRERQRQERQQMLPNDDKDISVGAQDLFHAPVKVKPSDDSTSAQIANTLGSFDTVRHLILDTSSRRLGNLIGVDQGSLPGTPVATRQPPQTLIPGHTPDQGSKPYFHSPLVAGKPGSSAVAEPTGKSHHRNLFTSSNNANNSNAVGNNSLTTSSEFNLTQSSGSFRPAGNSHQKGISHSQSSSTQQTNSSNHSTINSNPSSASQVIAAVGGSSSSSSNLTNSGHTNNSSAINNNQVRRTGLSFNNSNSSAPSNLTDVSSEGSSNVSSAKTVSNALLNKESHESASGADDKNSRHVSSNRKPALERADSQLEIESMLKEMMDVTAPLTAIQTPVKETSTKKFTQRRSSKSEEKIVQSIRDSGMADVPSPVQRMDSSGDSSSSYESGTSDSESEDSSSGSQAGGEKIDTAIPKITPNTNSPTRWNLSSFIRKNDYRGTSADANPTTTIGGSKSPKDTKPNAHQVNAINSETSPGDAPVKTESVVSSTSLLNKAQSLSPLDTPTTVTLPTRKITRSTAEVKSEPYVPPKPPTNTGNAKTPNSTNNPVTKSLSGSSSEEESEKQKKDVSRPTATGEQEKIANATGAGNRKRKRSSSSTERTAQKSGEESSPENAAKNKKNNIQDRNKNDTIRRLFMFKQKLDSPTRGDSSSDLGKSPSSGAPSTNGNGASNSTSASTTSAGNTAPTSAAGGSTSNRVQAKDSAKKSKDNSTTSSSVHNGELDASASSVGASVTEPVVSKKRDDGAKEKDSSTSSRTSHGKKNQKSAASGSASAGKAPSIPNAMLLLPPPPPPAAKIKEEFSGKLDKSLSSLVCKINLNKLKRKPSMMPAPPPPPPLAPPPPVVVKAEKDSTEKGVKTIKEPLAATSNNAELFLKRVHHNSSRVGSSSDHAKDAKETTVVTHNPPPGRVPPDGLCSDIDFRGKKRSKSKKVKSSSPKKTKTKHEPDSHSKVEEDTACGEVSSNVLGYASCDSVSVSTTRTPPVESDVVQAPDSSLNPPHLPSPVVPPQPVYYSYFEKSDHLEDYYSRDQDSYLEEAKRLKHKADGERVSTTQASVYLEAGLYFILTGISMERDRTVGSTAAFTMYKDTLVLIRYIGSRFRTRNAEYSNPMEAKIIVLSMRCQSMLSLKLFKIKMRETKEMVQYLQDHFQRHPTIDVPPVASSPQLSTPSPHSPTSSPAASSSLHPSPHHPNQLMTTIPRSLYSNMQKTCTSTMYLISAHELWETADHLVEKYHIEEFFIQLDRQFGPLTLHNSLVDLVRYVKQALQILKSSSELS